MIWDDVVMIWTLIYDHAGIMLGSRLVYK